MLLDMSSARIMLFVLFLDGTGKPVREESVELRLCQSGLEFCNFRSSIGSLRGLRLHGDLLWHGLLVADSDSWLLNLVRLDTGLVEYHTVVCIDIVASCLDVAR